MWFVEAGEDCWDGEDVMVRGEDEIIWDDPLEDVMKTNDGISRSESLAHNVRAAQACKMLAEQYCLLRHEICSRPWLSVWHIPIDNLVVKDADGQVSE